jgi:hypothetical protein
MSTRLSKCHSKDLCMKKSKNIDALVSKMRVVEHLPVMMLNHREIPIMLNVIYSAINEAMYDIKDMKVEDLYAKIAATYLFRVSTAEVKEFNRKEVIETIAVEKERILYSRNRLLESMEFTKITGFEKIDLSPVLEFMHYDLRSSRFSTF